MGKNKRNDGNEQNLPFENEYDGDIRELSSRNLDDEDFENDLDGVELFADEGEQTEVEDFDGEIILGDAYESEGSELTQSPFADEVTQESERDFLAPLFENDNLAYDEELPEKKQKSKLKKVVNVSLIVIAVILALAVLFINIFQLCYVMGDSMNDTLQDGEFLLMQRFGYKIERGDIITVYTDEDADYPIIKRVVAVKGDKLAFVHDGDDGVILYRDTGKGFEKLNEPYIKGGRMGIDAFWLSDKFASLEYKVSPNCAVEDIMDEFIIEVDGLFVLGDNRDDSYDSRHYGILPYSRVEGKMVIELKKGSFAEKFLKKLFNADKLALKRI